MKVCGGLWGLLGLVCMGGPLTYFGIGCRIKVGYRILARRAVRALSHR